MSLETTEKIIKGLNRCREMNLGYQIKRIEAGKKAFRKLSEEVTNRGRYDIGSDNIVIQGNDVELNDMLDDSQIQIVYNDRYAGARRVNLKNLLELSEKELGMLKE